MITRALIGNELHTRRHRLYFITQEGRSEPIEASNGQEIEELLVDRICSHFVAE